MKNVSINNGDGHLCNGKEEEEGLKRAENQTDQQHMLKSNGNPDFINETKNNSTLKVEKKR